jgi:hypothetical protein
MRGRGTYAHVVLRALDAHAWRRWMGAAGVLLMLGGCAGTKPGQGVRREAR